MGSASGGKAAAIAYTLTETAKFNDVDPQAWLAEILDRIPDYKINCIDELLPWNRSLSADPKAITRSLGAASPNAYEEAEMNFFGYYRGRDAGYPAE